VLDELQTSSREVAIEDLTQGEEGKKKPTQTNKQTTTTKTTTTNKKKTHIQAVS